MKKEYMIISIIVILALIVSIIFMIIKIYNPFFIEKVEVKEVKPDMPEELDICSKDNVMAKAYLQKNYWKCKKIDGVEKCIDDFKGISLIGDNTDKAVRNITYINSGNKLLLDLSAINEEYLKDENKTVEYFIYDNKEKLVRKYNLQKIDNMAVIDTSSLIKGRTYYINILLKMSNVVSTYVLVVSVK